MKRLLVSVSELAWIKFSDASLDDRAGNTQHLGIDRTVSLAKLRRSNLVGGALSDQHHPGAARLTMTIRPIFQGRSSRSSGDSWTKLWGTNIDGEQPPGLALHVVG
jgi:hypothetical protein